MDSASCEQKREFYSYLKGGEEKSDRKKIQKMYLF